jgi:sigma-B regulation protein RsbU (phosphoserine phosphatase)
MNLSYRYLRMRLVEEGLLPLSKVALIAWYLLGLDVLLFALQKLFGLFQSAWGQNLGGWVTFLSVVVIFLFALLAVRWIKAKLLWRLRNRLVVTYVFIGVIPVVLLAALTLGSFYLFAGQFATFIVTTGLNAELESLEATNSAIAHEIAARLEGEHGVEVAALEGLRHHHKAWADRQVCVWLDGKVILHNFSGGAVISAPVLPPYLRASFRDVVRDSGKLFLRATETIPARGGTLTVLSSEPFDQRLLQNLAANLGEVSLYASGTSEETPTYTAGTVPPPTRSLDRQVTFPTSVVVVNWANGDTSTPAAVGVQTRYSKLRERLFDASGDFASTAEVFLLLLASVFGIIELIALLISYRLTRTVTGTVAQLYDATRHINRGDFSHRIPVTSSDQLATLANSFNMMTASIEKLVEEQKAKQRLENELVIAQEVQAQLFPQHISQLATLEVYGFCRPARTVSGDYYDFLAMTEDKLLLAVGDISGKGISAALLMATVHSAVRAYSLEGIPILREPLAVGAGPGSTGMALGIPGPEVSPATLLTLLNHQLFQSTPAEKYATLFLSIYDQKERSLTYSNGGHLAPIILGDGHSIRRLDRGGMVVGLFDNQNYEEGSVQLRRGEVFLAYSDGVTEPENDFGEFGEERLIEIVRENRDLPLIRISEIVTAAVDDWIGANEQPDDVTLVLARAR